MDLMVYRNRSKGFDPEAFSNRYSIYSNTIVGGSPSVLNKTQLAQVAVQLEES
jgi:hypothetical protein